jgi:CheY-like chemotaxis protein
MDPSLNVLVAEDDENDAFLLQRAFHAIGMKHPLHIVHDGADAIDYLSGQGAFADRAVHPPANYVIVDLKMPRVDGFGVLEYLQKHGELLVIPTLYGAVPLMCAT